MLQSGHCKLSLTYSFSTPPFYTPLPAFCTPLPVFEAPLPTETRGPLSVSSRSHPLQQLLPAEARVRAVSGQPSWLLGRREHRNCRQNNDPSTSVCQVLPVIVPLSPQENKPALVKARAQRGCVNYPKTHRQYGRAGLSTTERISQFMLPTILSTSERGKSPFQGHFALTWGLYRDAAGLREVAVLGDSKGVDGSGPEAVASTSTVLERDLDGFIVFSVIELCLFGKASSNDQAPN